MNDLVSVASRSVSALSSRGEPAEFRTVETKLDALITVAAKLKEWDILEQAIDAKIEDQKAFVDWWDEKVRGAHRPETVSRSVTVSADAAETETGVTKMQVSRFRKSLKERLKYRERMIVAAYRKADLTPEENHRAEGTGENEWFTPAKYIEAARLVMGSIDLDPASNPIAQQTVQATQFFTREDDGLSKEWIGRVWLNPPYAQPLIGQFIEKLISELDAERVSEAVLLTHNYTDTAWFHMAEAAAERICFTKGRIRFVDADGGECSPTQGQALFYFGDQWDAFARIFSDFGFVR